MLDKDVLSDIRARIMEYMFRNAITWQEFAEKVGVSRFTIFNLCRRKRSISRRSFVLLDNFLSADEFLRRR